MRVCVFLGPTLSREAARRIWDEPEYLPPVRQGDLYAAARRRPNAIGVVDGYFKGVPAVWHKEILWAMARGIHVFGASSMGALRAAELAVFGMVGVGDVYDSLRRGDWEDDDEVAVVHGPEALDYAVLTEAMVNIRATIARAREEGVVDGATARRLVERAKSRPFTERTYERLLRDAEADASVDEQTLDAFRHWLPEGRVDQKAKDAVTLLTTLHERVDELTVPLRVDYAFEHTEAWRLVVERAPPTPSVASAAALALEGIKLDGTWQRLSRAALLRHVLSFGPGSSLETLDPDHLADARDMLRRSHGLWRADALAHWKEINGLHERDFAELVESEARVQCAAASLPPLDAHLVRELQARDDYAWRLEEAERMRVTLSDTDERWYESSAAATAPTLLELMAMTGIDVEPDEATAHALRSGFADADAFRRALLHRHRARMSTRTDDRPDEGGSGS